MPDQDDQQPVGGDPGRLSPAERERLVALHRLPLGLAAHPPPVDVAFLMAASTPAERETAARAHLAQAEQLRGPLPAALAGAYLTLEPVWLQVARALGPRATLGELLSLAPPELAAQVRDDLTAAGLDRDQLAWPPLGWPPSLPWPP